MIQHVRNHCRQIGKDIGVVHVQIVEGMCLPFPPHDQDILQSHLGGMLAKLPTLNNCHR